MEKVQLFATCLVDSFHSQIGEAMTGILNHLGVRVEFAKDQTCCSQPVFNSGLRVEARKAIQHTIRVFEKTSGDIVSPSGSCAHMLKHAYLEYFKEDPYWLSRAQALASRVYEFTEYIVDVMNIKDLGAYWDGTLTYHPSCHALRAMNIDRQPRILLNNVKGANIIALPEEQDCCGFGGMFSIEHPELSAEWLKRKIENFDKTEAPILVVTEVGCMMHIAGGLHRQKKEGKVMHISEILNNRS